MEEMDELAIKDQISKISNKIDSIIQKINDLEPEPEQTENAKDKDDDHQENI